jgi:hypothetical protein
MRQVLVGVFLTGDTPGNRRRCAGPNQRQPASLRRSPASLADPTRFTTSSADLFRNPQPLVTQPAAIGVFLRHHQNHPVCFSTSLPVSLPPPCPYRLSPLCLKAHVHPPHLQCFSRRYARPSACDIVGHQFSRLHPHIFSRLPHSARVSYGSLVVFLHRVLSHFCMMLSHYCN